MMLRQKRVSLVTAACVCVLLAGVAMPGCGTSADPGTTGSTVGTTSTTAALASTSTVANAPDKTVEFSSALPVQILDPDSAFADSDAVIVGRVVELLPFRVNPAADSSPDSAAKDDPNTPLPVTYRGAVIQVEKSEGPGRVAGNITVYYMSSGKYVDDDQKTIAVEVDNGLQLAQGDEVLIPITKFLRFGAPLGINEFWAYHEVTAFTINNGMATRAVTSHGAAESEGWADQYPLSTLESRAAAEAGTKVDRLSTKNQ